VGELAPHLTHDETLTNMFGINFGATTGVGYISLSAQNNPQIGYYTPNTFYHVTLIVNPTTSLFDITITGALRDTDDNPVSSITLKDVGFSGPVSQGGALRYINLWQDYRDASGTMGLDNVEIEEPTEPPPVITSISPVTGSTFGGTSVTISGFNFGGAQGTGSVTFGDSVASAA